MDNHQLKNIIKDIQLKEGIGLAEIAVQTGLDRSYLSAFIHAKVRKSVTEKMFGKLAKGYPAFFKRKQQDTTQSPDPERPLPGNVTLQDYIELYKKWLADKEAKYLDSHSAHMKLLDTFNKRLEEIAANLTTGQKQLGEQLFVVGDGLRQQLEGIASGLAARDAEKDKGVSGQKGNIHGKSKDH